MIREYYIRKQENGLEKSIKHLHGLLIESLRETDRESNLYCLFKSFYTKKDCEAIIYKCGYYVLVPYKYKGSYPKAIIRKSYDDILSYDTNLYLVNPYVLLTRGFYKEWAETQYVEAPVGQIVFSVPTQDDSYLPEIVEEYDLGEKVVFEELNLREWVKASLMDGLKDKSESGLFEALFGYSLCVDDYGNRLCNWKLIRRICISNKLTNVWDKIEKILLAYLYSDINDKYGNYESFQSNVDSFLKGYCSNFRFEFSKIDNEEFLFEE